MRTFASFIHPQSRRLGVLLALLCLLTGSFTLRAQDDKKAGESACRDANALFNQGLYKLAIVSYQKFLKKYPSHPKAIDVRYGLGLSHFLLNQYDKAAVLLGKIVSDPKCPDVPRAYYFWGQSLLMLGKPANAEGAFDVGIRALRALETPQDVLLLSNLKKGRLEALFQLSKWKDVVAASKSLQGKGGIRVTFHSALALYKLKRFKEATVAFVDLKPSVKNTAYEQRILFRLAESYHAQKQFELAIKEFKVAAGLKGNFASEALYRLGELQFVQLKYKEAVKSFDNFRLKYKDSMGKEKPDQFQKVCIYLGRAQLELHKYKVAEKLFVELAAESKAGAKAFLWQGRVLARQKKYVEAVKVLTGAIKKFPNNPEMPDLLFDLAINNFRLDNFVEAGKAIDDLQKAKPAFGQMADLLRLNAKCKFKTKDFDASLKLCGEFLRAYAQHEHVGDVRFLEAENHFSLNQYERAIGIYGDFLEDYKTHPQVNAAKMRIGTSQHELKDWAKVLAALEPLMKSKAKGSVFGQLEFLVADAHYQLGDWSNAVKFYKKFVEYKPKFERADLALYNAGLASEELKKKSDAIAAYQKLDKGYPDSVHLTDARLKLGKLFYNDKKYFEAKAVLRKVAVLKEHKLRPNAEFYLAWVALGEKKADVAAQQFGALADSFPQHELAADARLQQGMKLFDADQFPAAQTALQKFIIDYPKHEEIGKATYQLGFSQLKQDQWKAALVSFGKVPAKSEYRADALYQSAWCQKGASKQRDAVPYYEELLAEFPEGPLANTSSFELAELEFEAKKLNEAIRRVQGLILKKPKRDLLARTQQLLGLVYFEQKNFTEALLNFQKVVRTRKPTPRSKGDELGAKAQFLMGKCYFEQEMFDEAIEEYKKVEIDFPFPQWQSKAIYEVAMTLGRKGDKAEAREQLKRLVGKFPDTPAAADAKAKLD